MSTVAIPMETGFTPRFRSATTWSDSFGTDLTVSAMMNHNFPVDSSDSGDTPPSSTASMASSPSHSSYMIDHEMRRQRSRAQHTPRFMSRARQLSAGPYSEHSPSPSVESNLPYQHNTPTTTVSLMSEPISAVSSQNYLPSFNSPMPEPSSHSQAYGNHYQSSFDNRSQAYTVHMQYQTPYAPTAGFRSNHGSGHGQTSDLLYSSRSHQKLRHGTPPDQGHVKVVQSRPKPRCWDHGCNGRQFSTFSNLLRHQREKSGQATKSSCPNCGAEFTRTTARNGHLMHDKCKRRGV